MCLNAPIKKFKPNDNIRVGYKKQVQVTRHSGGSGGKWGSPYFHSNGMINHEVGSVNSDVKDGEIFANSYDRYPPSYDRGFHFYCRLPKNSGTWEHIRWVECLCWDIRATGRDMEGAAFVAKNYQIMRVVKEGE